MDSGWQIALSFIGIGLLWLIIVQFLVGVVEWLRALLG